MPRIVSWNINGVRSLPQSLSQILSSFDADVCCFQETKVTRSALDTSIAFVDGFNSYFAFCRKREGYSGVVTYCKDSCTPFDAIEGLSGQCWNRQCSTESTASNSSIIDFINDSIFTPDELKTLDNEGRAVITRHRLRILPGDNGIDIDLTRPEYIKYLNIINVYCPRLDPDRPDRKEFKRKFYRLLEIRAEQLVNSGDHVLIIGDLNCSHKPIDHCDPDSDPEFDQNESRKWMDEFLLPSNSTESQCQNESESRKFVDLFRWIYPDTKNAYTCWRNYGDARAVNFGSRIDYAIGDFGMIRSNLIEHIEHLTDVHGSDHCPVRVTLNHCQLLKSDTVPTSCTKFMPEFKGVQQQLHQFLVKRPAVESAMGSSERKQIRKMENASGKKSTSRTLKDYFTPISIVSSRDGLILPSRTVEASTSCSQPVPTQSTVSSPHHPFHSSQPCSTSSSTDSASGWDTIFWKLKNETPHCRGHGEPCVLRIVRKSGPNLNRRFYACSRPIGRKDDPNASCNFFQWAK